MSSHTPTEPKTKGKPTRGVLDYVDIIMGRLSSRTDEHGERIRSWGVTYNALMTIPAFLLVIAFSVAIVISASSTRNHVPRKVVQAYLACVKKVKKVDEIKKCPEIKATAGSKISDKAFEFGPWPWITVLALAGLGFLGMLLRNNEDVKTLSSLLDSASVFVTKEKPIPKELMEAITAQMKKLTGARPNPDLPAGPGVEK